MRKVELSAVTMTSFASLARWTPPQTSTERHNDITILPGPEVIKIMLNSAEHETLNAHKYEKYENIR